MIFYHLIIGEGKKGLYVPLFKICSACLFSSLLLTVASILYQLFEFLVTSAKSHRAIEDFLFILSHQERKYPSNQIQNYQKHKQVIDKVSNKSIINSVPKGCCLYVRFIGARLSQFRHLKPFSLLRYMDHVFMFRRERIVLGILFSRGFFMCGNG